MTKMFFAEDGSWGSANNIAIVDTAGLSDHFDDYIEAISEYALADWARWFADNNHEMPDDEDAKNNYQCYYCENFEMGTLAEIDKAFED